MISNYLSHMDEHVNFLHATRKPPFNVHFHLHKGCEIFFLIRGDVNYFVEKTVYPLQYGDLIITNEHEIHKPAILSEAMYERVTIEFDPALFDMFQTEQMVPLRCFYDRPLGEKNKISLNEAEAAALLQRFHTLDQVTKHPFPGDALVKLGCMLEIIAQVQRLYDANHDKEAGLDMPVRLTPILAFLDQHLAEELSLERLEKLFFISKFHLSRLFKKYTGSTIHEYIVVKRIALAKKLLKEGATVTEACLGSGFNDYTSFLRMFKKKVGVLPKHYAKQKHPNWNESK
ncbi:AraC family transcriptional regulator [Paenibacillus oryzisoli]|uniref:helix-turn-helix domain-containing protein n=1 Tax=Paenibacillus oryzisoli TaxID=1850517 RepID=UPI003D2A1D3C